MRQGQRNLPRKRMNFADVGARRSDNKPMNMGTVDPNRIQVKPMSAIGFQPTVAATNDDPLGLNIIRETNNILQKLPFAVFAPVNIDDNYIPVFESCRVMPANADVVFSFENGDGIFTWTIGGLTDRIRITNTGLVSYAAQMRMIQGGGYFTSIGFRYNAMETNQAKQYAAYNVFSGSSDFYGVTRDGSTRIKSMKAPSQYQNAIIDVAIRPAMDQTRYLVHGFPNDPATPENEISWDFFDVEYFSGSVFESSNC